MTSTSEEKENASISGDVTRKAYGWTDALKSALVMELIYWPDGPIWRFLQALVSIIYHGWMKNQNSPKKKTPEV